jgi:hypothetical protein
MGGQQASTDDLWARAEANNYVLEQHLEVDSKRQRGLHIDTKIKNHVGTLRRYVLCVS